MNSGKSILRESEPATATVTATTAAAAATQSANHEPEPEPNFESGSQSLRSQGAESLYLHPRLRRESSLECEASKNQQPVKVSANPKLLPEFGRVATAVSSNQADFQNAAEERQPWYRRLNPLRWGQMPPVPKERIISPEYGASWFSKLVFEWMTPIMKVGYRRPLELNDIWLVNPDRKIDLLADRFNALFQDRVARGSRYPLLWAIHDTFQSEFWHGALYLFFASICQVMSPFTLRFLITYVTEAFEAGKGQRDSPSLGRGLGLVFAIMIMQMLQSLGTNQFIYHGFIVGGQARGVLVTAIFEKSMKISGQARAGGKSTAKGGFSEDEIDKEVSLREKKDFAKRFFKAKTDPGKGVKLPEDATRMASGDGLGWPNGRVVNMMSTDTYRIDQACGMFHLIWASPMTILITLVILLVNLTSSALAGFSLLFLGIPALTIAVKSLIGRRLSINKVTDLRVSLTQEILKSVRFVKYYGWEGAFLARLRGIRRKEITLIQTLLTMRNGINAVSVSLPIFASMLSFIVYSLTKHKLTPATVFSSLSLFNTLRVPFNLLPVVIGQVTDAWTSIGRIQEYLMAEEQQDDVIWNMQAKQGVLIEHAHFVWERTATQDFEDKDPRAKRNAKPKKKYKKGFKNQSIADLDEKDTRGGENAWSNAEPFALHDINISVNRNELVAVIGTVGSGKSSLLAALAGDMRRTSGQVTLGGTRAFCPQYAWIQNTTVKENILFGKDMDRKRYEEVIQVCALQPDLDMLPAGEETEIGERGITLSGGQKQRLNIARAIYSDSQIILMDDPLSAVDAHVGRHIFEQAICGLLRNKCRLLATHQLHVLSRCDRIVWLDEGRIKAVDTFDNLMKNEMDFRKTMALTTQEEQPQRETRVSEDEMKEEKKDVQMKGTIVKKGATLMQEEERAVKSVSWGVYIAYIRSSGTIVNGLLPILLLVLAQGANVATNLWLSYWTSNQFGYSKGKYIGIYVGLGVIQALLMFAFSVSLSILGTVASRAMLDRALARVLKAPMSFFDTTPLGRITNRFAKDVDVMDNNLTDAIRTYLFTLALIMSVFILLIVFFHYSGIALGPLLILFLFAAAYYRASAREMKRHEAVLRSVMFARFGEAITGTASIRAYGLQDHFTRILRNTIDGMNSAYYLTFSNQRWLSTRLDIISNMLVVTTGILIVTLRFAVSPSISGLVFSYILSIVQMIQLLVRQLAEVENAMNATERLHYYGTRLEEEKTAPPITEVAKSWPERGEIHFKDVRMRYRDGLPLVLRGFDMKVAGGERIGIVGRTGAGKSSIMNALFRLSELSGGNVTIDDVDIAKLPLQTLRSRLAIIPQDPTLFHGTIRSNLDPFNEHTDLELWSALRQAGLIESDAAMNDRTRLSRVNLDSVVEEEGLNFSLGQRQLMALARALVRDSQIIVCDEATSSVDVETDKKIQQTITESFRGKTLLCIAHRLKTIIGYDRICVIDQGRIAELGSPLALWDADGIFRSMCERSGIARKDFFGEVSSLVSGSEESEESEDYEDYEESDEYEEYEDYGVDWSGLDMVEVDLSLGKFGQDRV